MKSSPVLHARRQGARARGCARRWVVAPAGSGKNQSRRHGSRDEALLQFNMALAGVGVRGTQTCYLLKCKKHSYLCYLFDIDWVRRGSSADPVGTLRISFCAVVGCATPAPKGGDMGVPSTLPHSKPNTRSYHTPHTHESLTSSPSHPHPHTRTPPAHTPSQPPLTPRLSTLSPPPQSSERFPSLPAASSKGALSRSAALLSHST